jgi:hypothetical protein
MEAITKVHFNFGFKQFICNQRFKSVLCRKNGRRLFYLRVVSLEFWLNSRDAAFHGAAEIPLPYIG